MSFLYTKEMSRKVFQMKRLLLKSFKISFLRVKVKNIKSYFVLFKIPKDAAIIFVVYKKGHSKDGIEKHNV